MRTGKAHPPSRAGASNMISAKRETRSSQRKALGLEDLVWLKMQTTLIARQFTHYFSAKSFAHSAPRFDPVIQLGF
jgi:hypothetical protein